jgi:hypothetical protein
MQNESIMNSREYIEISLLRKEVKILHGESEQIVVEEIRHVT